MFRRVFVANRGEIAVRIIRTLREMGLTSIAAYSDADRDALFVEEADEAFYLGGSAAQESYLNTEAIVSLARDVRSDAIHPGYGFLAENADFAQTSIDAGLTFVGPSPHAIHIMGDKVAARQAVSRLGVPVVPGTVEPVTNLDDALSFGREMGFPIAVKAAGGGGGRGIRIVEKPTDLADALEAARREAQAHFKRPHVYLERYFPEARHVEIQILGDVTGHLVHLGERDCSTQRRHQKLIEETPSPAVDRKLREHMGEMAIRAARSVGYATAGTVEFLLTPDNEFYFLEMNTRIQVEHPITETVTGVDLIREMILAAAGENLTVKNSVDEPTGHAIEVRVNAEDPTREFRPTPGLLREYREPGGPGVRLDSGVYQGSTIPAHYDSLMAKLIVWAPDRSSAIQRTLRALREFRIVGPASTVPFADAVLRHPTFTDGKMTTTFVEAHLSELQAAMTLPLSQENTGSNDGERGDTRSFDIQVNRKRFRVQVAELRPKRAAGTHRNPRARHIGASDGVVRSPMHGTVIRIAKQAGELVDQGDALFVIEAMKMENEVTAQRAGTLSLLSVAVGDTVESDQQLAVID